MLQNYFAITNRTELTKERSRAILPILVRQAMAGQMITYGDLGEELGLHHRTLRHPLGCIREVLSEMSTQWAEEIPQIQGIVVNKQTRLPGESVYFLRHNPDTRQREEIVEEVLRQVFSYPRWLDVLEELGLSPTAPLNS